jgi:sugar phosphate permease
MQSSPSGPWWLQLLPLAVVVVVLAIRLVRPQRISVTRMWIQPLILVALIGWAIYASQMLNPTPGWEIAAALAIGAIAGVPFGILRGVHTDVRPTQRAGVMYLGSSWMTVLIFAVAFGLRAVIRLVMPHRGSLSGAIGDGLLAFAIAFVAASYIVIFRKYEAEVAGRLAAPPAPPEA